VGITVSAPVVAAIAAAFAVGAIIGCLSTARCRDAVIDLVNRGIGSIDAFVDSLKSVVVESRYTGDKRNARDIINADKKGGIWSVFPKEWADKTYDEIAAAAKAGNRSAKTAKKLLDSIEYDKGSKR
jgi:hypothetical protein